MALQMPRIQELGFEKKIPTTRCSNFEYWMRGISSWSCVWWKNIEQITIKNGGISWLISTVCIY